MARKKVNPEPQEKPIQDTDAPVAGMDGEGIDPAPDEPTGGDDAAPRPAGDGVEDAFSGDFPAADEPPFEGAPEGEAVPEGDIPMEMPPSADGMPSDGDAAGDGSVPTMEDADYTAFLQAVSEGGGVTPAPKPAPLLLDDSGEGSEDGYNADALPPAPDGDAPSDEGPADNTPAPARVVDRRSASRRERVLTIDPHAEVQTQEDLEDLIWHELQNANRTKHILTGKLDSVGRTQNGMDTAIILYKGVRVLIPLKEMGVHTGQVPSGPEYAIWVDQITRILHARQDCDIDFVVRGIDEDSRTVAASRRDAMHRKRKRFYLDTDELGHHMIEEGRIVQARVVAVADKLIRVEVFGVECNVAARGSAWMWAGSARDKHYVGELILVRVQKIERVNADRITIQVDSRSVFGEDGDNLSQCQPQCRYVGQVTDVRKGVVFVRLNIGVNAIAHTCYDMRMPGKKDTVSFAVTRLDEKQGIAIGIITRIIKQNL